MLAAAAALCAWTVSGSEIELFSNFWRFCNLLGNCLAHGCGVSSVAFFFKNTFVTSPNFTCDSFGMSAEMSVALGSCFVTHAKHPRAMLV